MIRRVLVVVVCLLSMSMWAQMPDKFTNLQVLPKDIGKEDLMQVMRNFSFATGLRCEGCHVQKADKKIDFPLDDKEQKKTARVMWKMVMAINGDYIDKLGKANPNEVRCVTCHHGISQPRTLNNLMAETIEKQNVAAAIAQYRDLRTKYYGTGAYDFGETALNLLTEQLSRQKKIADAVAIVELNAEVNAPVSGWGLNLAGMAHRDHGDTGKAKADYKKALEANPENQWAKKQLEELNAAK